MLVIAEGVAPTCPHGRELPCCAGEPATSLLVECFSADPGVATAQSRAFTACDNRLPSALPAAIAVAAFITCPI